MRVPLHKCSGCRCWLLAPHVTLWKAVLKKRLFIRCVVCSRGHSVIALLLTLPCGPGPRTPVTYMLSCSIVPWSINWATRYCWRAVITGFIYCSVMVPPITASSGEEHGASIQSIMWLWRGQSQLSSTSWAYLWREDGLIHSSVFGNTKNAVNSQVYKLGGCKGGVIV